MRTNELRIGNRVKCKVSNDAAIYTVVAIDGINARVMLSGARMGTWYDVDKIKSVSISKDYLLKCGLGEVGIYDNVFHIGDVRVYLDKSRTKGLFKYENSSGNVEIEVEYIHQLQNIYFAIVKVELEVIL